MKFPIRRLRAVLKCYAMLAQKFSQLIFVADEVAEFRSVFQCEFERLNRAVKTHEADVARNIFCGAQNGERVGRRAEADVPDHKFAGMIFETLAQTELIDVKRPASATGPMTG